MNENEVSIKLSIFYEDPYWIGLFEKLTQGRYSACRVVFGPEPRMPQISKLINEQYHRLRFSLPQRDRQSLASSPVNPKRRQRAIAREMNSAQAPEPSKPCRKNVKL